MKKTICILLSLIFVFSSTIAFADTPELFSPALTNVFTEALFAGNEEAWTDEDNRSLLALVLLLDFCGEVNKEIWEYGLPIMDGYGYIGKNLFDETLYVEIQGENDFVTILYNPVKEIGSYGILEKPDLTESQLKEVMNDCFDFYWIIDYIDFMAAVEMVSDIFDELQ